MTGPGMRRIRALALGGALIGLAGCVAQPIGTLDPATITSEAAQAQADLYFRPGTASFLPGQAEEANALLRSLLLRPEDDVVLTFGSTGSDVLNARRIAAARAALATGPARLRIIGPLGFARAPDRPDVVLMQVLRYDRALVTCPGLGRTQEDPSFLLTIPPMGCTNAVNLASQAADLRDLTAPRRLEGSDAVVGVSAVERYRRGEVTVQPLETVSSGD
jgi:type IV pilus biogenesis protein CpaD/CtpE